MSSIYLLLAAYYLLGWAAIVVINRKSDAGSARERWLKYLVYVLITLVLTVALDFIPWLAISIGALVVLGGGYELTQLSGLSQYGKASILLAYLLISALFLVFLESRSGNEKPAAGTYLVVLSFDGFSQIFGQLIGGQRIAPRVSPGKTYSGFLGGLFVGVATVAFERKAVSQQALAYGSLVCMLAFTGDLLASAIKRSAGVKDYSALIPGHGGVLDRFDSFLFTGAVLECYFRFV